VRPSCAGPRYSIRPSERLGACRPFPVRRREQFKAGATVGSRFFFFFAGGFACGQKRAAAISPMFSPACLPAERLGGSAPSSIVFPSASRQQFVRSFAESRYTRRWPLGDDSRGGGPQRHCERTRRGSTCAACSRVIAGGGRNRAVTAAARSALPTKTPQSTPSPRGTVRRVARRPPVVTTDLGTRATLAQR